MGETQGTVATTVFFRADDPLRGASALFGPEADSVFLQASGDVVAVIVRNSSSEVSVAIYDPTAPAGTEPHIVPAPDDATRQTVTVVGDGKGQFAVVFDTNGGLSEGRTIFLSDDEGSQPIDLSGFESLLVPGDDIELTFIDSRLLISAEARGLVDPRLPDDARSSLFKVETNSPNPALELVAFDASEDFIELGPDASRGELSVAVDGGVVALYEVVDGNTVAFIDLDNNVILPDDPNLRGNPLGLQAFNNGALFVAEQGAIATLAFFDGVTFQDIAVPSEFTELGEPVLARIEVIPGGAENGGDLAVISVFYVDAAPALARHFTFDGAAVRQVADPLAEDTLAAVIAPAGDRVIAIDPETLYLTGGDDFTQLIDPAEERDFDVENIAVVDPFVATENLPVVDDTLTTIIVVDANGQSIDPTGNPRIQALLDLGADDASRITFERDDSQSRQTYTYDASDLGDGLQPLLEGEKIVVTYTVNLEGTNGITGTSTVEIAIEGAADEPLVTITDVTGLTEDGPLAGSGTYDATEADGSPLAGEGYDGLAVFDTLDVSGTSPLTTLELITFVDGDGVAFQVDLSDPTVGLVDGTTITSTNLDRINVVAFAVAGETTATEVFVTYTDANNEQVAENIVVLTQTTTQTVEVFRPGDTYAGGEPLIPAGGRLLEVAAAGDTIFLTVEGADLGEDVVAFTPNDPARAAPFVFDPGPLAEIGAIGGSENGFAVFSVAEDGNDIPILYVTDGTESGTREVIGDTALLASNNPGGLEFEFVGDQVLIYFRGDDALDQNVPAGTSVAVFQIDLAPIDPVLSVFGFFDSTDYAGLGSGASTTFPEFAAVDGGALVTFESDDEDPVAFLDTLTGAVDFDDPSVRGRVRDIEAFNDGGIFIALNDRFTPTVGVYTDGQFADVPLPSTGGGNRASVGEIVVIEGGGANGSDLAIIGINEQTPTGGQARIFTYDGVTIELIDIISDDFIDLRDLGGVLGVVGISGVSGAPETLMYAGIGPGGDVVVTSDQLELGRSAVIEPINAQSFRPEIDTSATTVEVVDANGQPIDPSGDPRIQALIDLGAGDPSRITFNGDNTYDYDATDLESDLQPLNDDETLVVTYTASIQDSSGNTGTTTFKVAISGSDDFINTPPNVRVTQALLEEDSLDSNLNPVRVLKLETFVEDADDDVITVLEGSIVYYQGASDLSGLEPGFTLDFSEVGPNGGQLSIPTDQFDALGEGEEARLAFSYEATDGIDTRKFPLTVKVVGVNDAPDVPAGQTFDTDEGASAGSAVGTVATSDVDGGPLVFNITGGNSARLFDINHNTGDIITTRVLGDGDVGDYDLTVDVFDGFDTTTETVSVTVNDTDPGGGDSAVVSILNDWGSGAIVQIAYTLTPEDGTDVTQWTFDIDLADGVFVNGWLNGYNDTVSFDPATGLFTDANSHPSEPSLSTGDTLVVNVQVGGLSGPLDPDDFAFDFTPLNGSSGDTNDGGDGPGGGTDSDLVVTVETSNQWSSGGVVRVFATNEGTTPLEDVDDLAFDFLAGAEANVRENEVWGFSFSNDQFDVVPWSGSTSRPDIAPGETVLLGGFVYDEVDPRDTVDLTSDDFAIA